MTVASLIRDLRSARAAQRDYAAQADRLTRESLAARSLGNLRKQVTAYQAAEIAARAGRAERDDPEPAT